MVFDKKQAAAYLRISVETVDKFRETGKLSYCKIGDRVVFRQEHLDEFLDAVTIPAKALPSIREMQLAAGRDKQHLRETVLQREA
jgi:excisionase family DNA binding protein